MPPSVLPRSLSSNTSRAKEKGGRAQSILDVYIKLATCMRTAQRGTARSRRPKFRRSTTSTGLRLKGVRLDKTHCLGAYSGRTSQYCRTVSGLDEGNVRDTLLEVH